MYDVVRDGGPRVRAWFYTTAGEAIEAVAEPTESLRAYNDEQKRRMAEIARKLGKVY